MADCEISINYGIPSTGADEYNVSTGREMFRCGTDCAKIFLTNLTVEKTTVKIMCENPGDAKVNEVFCLQSGQASFEDMGSVNWIGKVGANSSWDNGSLITKAGSCGSSPFISTHREGSLSGKGIGNVENIASNKEDIKNKVQQKVSSFLSEINLLEFFLQNISVSASPNSWNSGSVSYAGIDSNPGDNQTGSVSFDWNSGQAEVRTGVKRYDELENPDITTCVNSLIA